VWRGLGVAPTGKPFNYQGIALLRIEHGKIVDDTAYWDNLSILEQMGVAVPPEHTAS
jgi:ketosteroid isomerase-like protein